MEETVSLDYQGAVAIAGAVIKRARLDYRSNSPRLRRDVEEFYASDWYETLLDIGNVDLGYVKRKMEEIR